jgi:hypothetical protein
MKPKKGIILPGKIGDIVICLPIAKHYFDMGYDIYWPIYSEIIENFIDYIDYVNFIPIQFNNCIPDSFKILNDLKCEIIDLSFTSHGAWDNENSKKFLNQEKSFDEFRYNLANVPFEKKWTLEIKRDFKRENDLFSNLIKRDYAVMHLTGSECKKEIVIKNLNNYQLLEISPITKSIFDWIKILIFSKYIVTLDSCFANLVDQLNLPNKKIFLTRSDKLRTPVLKNNWKIQ